MVSSKLPHTAEYAVGFCERATYAQNKNKTTPPAPVGPLRQGLLLKMPATAGASCPFTHPPSCRPTYEVLHGMDHMILSSQPCIKKVLP
jgi:hypothetical protein